jgi:hypothetical protein
MKPEIADCCAICNWTPFVNKRKGVQKCETAKDFVFEISTCPLFDRNETRVKRRFAGLRSAIKQTYKG